MSGQKTRVAVICHHELIRIGAQAVFEADYDLEVFNDSTAIVATLKTYKPDVIMENVKFSSYRAVPWPYRPGGMNHDIFDAASTGANSLIAPALGDQSLRT